MTDLDMNDIVDTCDLALITLDTLRYDVAESAMSEGRTPNLRTLFPRGWEKRHSPGSFTYAAHTAFFAGFLPTPVDPGPHPRLFALDFPGSETIAETTVVMDAPDLVTGLRGRGYRTICIGGVGFFNKATPLGSALPSLFDESYWTAELGVTETQSFENQIDVCETSHDSLHPDQLAFTFLNVSALHQPNRHYLPGATVDSVESQAAALAHVDEHLPRLFRLLCRRRPCFVLIMSDHGTAYGEDGHVGHRIGHEVVWTVPYGHALIESESWPSADSEPERGQR